MVNDRLRAATTVIFEGGAQIMLNYIPKTEIEIIREAIYQHKDVKRTLIQERLKLRRSQTPDAVISMLFYQLAKARREKQDEGTINKLLDQLYFCGIDYCTAYEVTKPIDLPPWWNRQTQQT